MGWETNLDFTVGLRPWHSPGARILARTGRAAMNVCVLISRRLHRWLPC